MPIADNITLRGRINKGKAMREKGQRQETADELVRSGAEEPPHSPRPDAAEPPPEGGAGWAGGPAALGRQGGCLKAFATGCLTLFVLLAALGYVVFRNIRGISTELVREEVVRMVKESELPQDQQEGVIQKVNRVAEEFKRGRLTVEDVQRMVQEMADGPVFALAWLVVAEGKYVAPSGLDEQEKREAVLAIQRFARGVSEGRIPRDDVRDAINRITWDAPEGNDRQMKDSLSPEELRAFIAKAEQAANAADIPREPFQADIAEEVGKVVDRFLEE